MSVERVSGQSSSGPRQPLSCDDVEAALSAELDGERSGLDPDAVRKHVVGCPTCAEFEHSLNALPAPRPSLVGLTQGTAGRVQRAAARADRSGAPLWVRVPLGLIAGWIVALSIPDFLASGSDGVAAHSERHLGAFSAAYGVLLLLVAVRPARARTALPVSLVLAAAIGLTAIGDLVRGEIPLAGETLHVPELVSAALVWVLTSPRFRAHRANDRGRRPSDLSPDW